VTEKQLRDYLLFVKLKKMWKPKTLRQALASAKLFFVGQLGHKDWQIFSQVRAKDHHTLPPVLTRQQVVDLIAHIHLRRYRTPIKLIYCCGLRLGECLAITIHDILGKENKLWVRNAKGHRDRMVPLPTAMYLELRKYWAFHQHPLMLFPNVKRGNNSKESTAKRMREATTAMPYCSLQRLIIVARQELNLPAATIHSLRHSFATHMMEAGAHVSTVQKILGHKNIETTMVYMHMTHHATQDALSLMEGLVKGLPK
jgi:integrase